MPKHGLRSERFPLLWTPDRRRRCLAANSFGKAEVVKSRGQSEMASVLRFLSQVGRDCGLSQANGDTALGLEKASACFVAHIGTEGCMLSSAFIGKGADMLSSSSPHARLRPRGHPSRLTLTDVANLGC